MNTFQLEIDTLITYTGLNVHPVGKVVGIDYYSKIEHSNVVKTWTSYSITSAPDLDVEAQMSRGDRWWITWDGLSLREWIYAIEDEVRLTGKVIESVTGDIAVEFAGDAGVSTSHGRLFVYQDNDDTDLWHAKEEFYTSSGRTNIIYFLSKPIASADEIKTVESPA